MRIPEGSQLTTEEWERLLCDPRSRAIHGTVHLLDGTSAHRCWTWWGRFTCFLRMLRGGVPLRDACFGSWLLRPLG